MTLILAFAALSMLLPVAGGVCGAAVWWRDRRRLRRAFARGRVENVARFRLPVVVSSPLTARGAVVAAAPGALAPVEPRHDEQETH